MGMYCDCGQRRNVTNENGETIWDKNCRCDLTGFVKCSEILPPVDGIYEVRIHTDSGDIYHDHIEFVSNPIIKERDGYYSNQTWLYHWPKFASWDDDIVSMWREKPVRIQL